MLRTANQQFLALCAKHFDFQAPAPGLAQARPQPRRGPAPGSGPARLSTAPGPSPASALARVGIKKSSTECFELLIKNS